MTLLELFQLLKKHLKLVIALPVVCAIAMGVVSFTMMDNTYTATTSMYILAKTDGGQTSYYNDLSASQMLSNDIATLLDSDSVKSGAAKELGLSSLADYKVSVTSETTTRVISLSVTGASPDGAAAVANAMANSVSTVAQDVDAAQAVNVIDKAKVPAQPSGPNRKLYIAVAALAGLFVAVAIVVLLDMLNTRYLIVPGKEGQPEAQRRTTAFGAAWFVDSVIYAPSAQAEIDLLGKTNLRTTAVVSGQNPAKSASRPMPLGIYASARIELTEYRPNYLKYEYTLPEEAVAVFSEIFYDQGWKAYVDGEESPYFRADYVLRAMTLPAGTHTVEWRFRAPGWTAVEGVTLAASLAILLGAVAALAYCFRKRTEKEK